MYNILFFIDTLTGGGAEKVLCNLVNNMDQDKFQIAVQTTWPVDPSRYLAPGIQYRSIYPRENKFYHLLYRLEAALGLVYPRHMKGSYDIEVAYLECGPTKILASSTNKKALKLAWVHCDLQKKMSDISAFQKKASQWYKKYHQVVCVSEDVKKSYIELFGTRPPAAVVCNTVDDGEILRKAQASLPASVKKQKFTIVTLGRLSVEKGFNRLLYAHQQLIADGFDHNLWILGEGPERTSLENYISENNLSQSVTLFGFQSNPYPFLREADLLVCSSLYEGVSTFVTEGLILGKPIVTTDCSGMDMLLGNSEWGLRTSNSTEGLYNGIKKMLTDQNLLIQYTEKAKLRGTDFQARILASKTEKFLIQQLEEQTAL